MKIAELHQKLHDGMFKHVGSMLSGMSSSAGLSIPGWESQLVETLLICGFNKHTEKHHDEISCWIQSSGLCFFDTEPAKILRHLYALLQPR